MSDKGTAPKFFGKISRRGTPVRALVATACIAASAFFASILGDGVAYTAAYYLCGIAGIYNWLTISVAHYRFRKGWIRQGNDPADLPYKSPLFPFGTWFVIVVCIIVSIGANYWVFIEFNWFDFITCYAIIPISIVMFFVYKKKRGTKWVKYEEMDFTPPEDADIKNFSGTP
jgi:amino acid permease